jgi:hypothetical protein
MRSPRLPDFHTKEHPARHKLAHSKNIPARHKGFHPPLRPRISLVITCICLVPLSTHMTYDVASNVQFLLSLRELFVIEAGNPGKAE